MAAIVKARERVADRLQAQSLACGYELLLKTEDAPSGMKASPELISVEGLSEVVIGAGSQAVNEILLLSLGRQQQHVGIVPVSLRPKLTTDLGPVLVRHHPVEDGELGSAFHLEDFPGFGAVVGYHRLVTPLFQHRLNY